MSLSSNTFDLADRLVLEVVCREFRPLGKVLSLLSFLCAANIIFDIHIADICSLGVELVPVSPDSSVVFVLLAL